jgi:uncharacterized membrane protein
VVASSAKPFEQPFPYKDEFETFKDHLFQTLLYNGNMIQPKITIRIGTVGWILEIVAISFVVLSFLVLVVSYEALPSTIPHHYNKKGEADGFGDKATIWLLPVLNLCLYVLLTAAGRYPHLFNFPYKITRDNIQRQYQNSILMLRVIKLIITINFFYLVYATVQNGLGKMQGIGSFFLPVFLASIVGTVAAFIYSGYRKK